MTRGLLSCSTCCMLFGQLYDGRCATCANRWAALTNQPLPVPPAPVLNEKPKPKSKSSQKTCKSCNREKQMIEMAPKKNVGKRHRGWCLTCVDLDRLAIAEDKALKMQKIKHLQTINAHKYNPMGRKCTKCFLFKSWDSFHFHATGANGRLAICKQCKSAANRWNHQA